MKKYRLPYRQILCLCFLAAVSFTAVAAGLQMPGYSMYGYMKRLNDWVPSKYSVNATVEAVDWDDPRPLECDIPYTQWVCIVHLRATPEGQGGSSESYYYFPRGSIPVEELRERGIRTVGEYLRYARERGVNFFGSYEWGGVIYITGQIRYFRICLNINYGQTKQPLSCTTRGLVMQMNCTIEESQRSIEHGTLSADRVNGHRASVNLTVSCNGNSSAKLISPNPNSTLPLAPDGSLFTTLTVGGRPLSEGVVVNVGPGGTNVTLTSTLGTKGAPRTGRFSGSVVVVLASP